MTENVNRELSATGPGKVKIFALPVSDEQTKRRAADEIPSSEERLMLQPVPQALSFRRKFLHVL